MKTNRIFQQFSFLFFALFLSFSAQAGINQKVVTEIPEANVKRIINSYKAKGYAAIWIDGFRHRTGVATNGKTKTFFNVIFEKKSNAADYQISVGLDFIVYPAGHPVMQLESYLSNNGKIRYAVIYRSSGSANVKSVHVPANQFQAKFNQMKGQGYHLVSRSIVRKGGSLFTTGLFEKSNVGAWLSKPNLTAGQATNLMLAQHNKGRTLVHMDIPNKFPTRYNLIFHTKPANAGWYAKNNLTKAQLTAEIAQAKGNGYRVTR